jgi:hypothetical protein
MSTYTILEEENETMASVAYVTAILPRYRSASSFYSPELKPSYSQKVACLLLINREDL